MIFKILSWVYIYIFFNSVRWTWTLVLSLASTPTFRSTNCSFGRCNSSNVVVTQCFWSESDRFTCQQCCGTGVFFCGSGSRSSFRFRLRFQITLPFYCKKQHCFPESWLLVFDFLLLFLFYSILCWILIQIRSGTGTHSSSGSAMTKSSGSSTLLVGYHPL